MISDEVRARIRRLFFAEHWKVGTIASELGVHHDTVRGAIDADRFVSRGARVAPSMLDPYKAFVQETLVFSRHAPAGAHFHRRQPQFLPVPRRDPRGERRLPGFQRVQVRVRAPEQLHDRWRGAGLPGS